MVGKTRRRERGSTGQIEKKHTAMRGLQRERQTSAREFGPCKIDQPRSESVRKPPPLDDDDEEVEGDAFSRLVNARTNSSSIFFLVVDFFRWSLLAFVGEFLS